MLAPMDSDQFSDHLRVDLRNSLIGNGGFLGVALASFAEKAITGATFPLLGLRFSYASAK
jgi:hypothetical protein